MNFVVRGVLSFPALCVPIRPIPGLKYERRYSVVLKLLEDVLRVYDVADRFGLEHFGNHDFRNPVQGFHDTLRVKASRPASLGRPYTVDETGMPVQPDLFEAGQHVEISTEMYAYEFGIQDYSHRGVGLTLERVQFLGGPVRSES